MKYIIDKNRNVSPIRTFLNNHGEILWDTPAMSRALYMRFKDCNELFIFEIKENIGNKCFIFEYQDGIMKATETKYNVMEAFMSLLFATEASEYIVM